MPDSRTPGAPTAEAAAEAAVTAEATATAEAAATAPDRRPVTADDLDLAVDLAVTTLRAALDSPDWDAKAGALDWSCWETVEHLSDDLFFYAAQIGPATTPLNGPVPFRWEEERPGGPANLIRADRAAGPAGLLQVLQASAAMLSALVRTKPPTVRAFHVYGVSDPEGFAAMGLVEVLVHLHDLAQGLALDWTPPAGLCRAVLDRLWPDTPVGTDPWATLLWATGRGELPGRARLTAWRWDGRPRD
ncbi:maleylpyruvate isomerase N-terminal domain-containing protein [Streptomyces physcomitrii]|uniref:maleylpyruvate isomerase N-terminal domain-containing protein n=1 Tax=Streptomyces physcomitrii TaxID=2724184 RepID=UPI00341F2B05